MSEEQPVPVTGGERSPEPTSDPTDAEARAERVAEILPLLESTSVTMPSFDPSRPLLDLPEGPARVADQTISKLPEMAGYRVEKLLGQGAMGKVYLGRHQLLGRAAAIKVLHAEHADQEAVERFFLEARAASNIDHPGIVKVYDVGQDECGSFLIMELLDGETLEDRLLRAEALQVHTAVRFAVQIAGALQAAHENGIVHRDLKPGNLFIVADSSVSGRERIKILDFGIAKVISSSRDAEADSDEKTRSDILLGSPAYISPEQCRGAQAVDGRADLYSLGCIVFEMLCGRPPFNQQMVAEVIAAHLREPPPRLTDLRPEVSPGLEAVVLRLLDKDADRRYHSADAVIDAIVSDSERTVMVRNVGFKVKRSPLAVLALATVFIVLAAGAIGIFGLSGGGQKSATQGGGQAARGERSDPGVWYQEPTLLAPERPELRVRLLGATQIPGGPDGPAVTVASLDELNWDAEFTTDMVTQLSRGQLTLGAVPGAELFSVENGQLMVPWLITSEPAGASVRFKNSNGPLLPDKAKTPLYVRFEPVDRIDMLIVSLPGHEDEEVAVRFSLPQREHIVLAPIPSVTVQTRPTGAQVYLDGRDVGASTPWTVPLSRTSAPRQLSLRLASYEDTDLVLAPGIDLDEPIALTPWTEVTLQTRPSGVEVIEVGAVVGRTPYTTRFSVKKGKVRVLVLHRGEEYDDVEIRLGPDQSLEIADSLIEFTRKVKLTLRTRPRKVAVYEVREADAGDGEPIAHTPWTTYISRTGPSRKIVLRADGYEDVPLTVDPDARLPRRVKLPRVPVYKLDSRPRGAAILTVQGEQIAVTPHSIAMPRTRPEQSFVLRSPGYEDLPVTLVRGRKPPRKFRMRRQSVTDVGEGVRDDLASAPSKKTLQVVLSIASEPSGADVYVADRRIGRTPLKYTPPTPTGNTTFRIKLDGYQPRVLKFANEVSARRRVRLEECNPSGIGDLEAGTVDPYACRD